MDLVKSYLIRKDLISSTTLSSVRVFMVMMYHLELQPLKASAKNCQVNLIVQVSGHQESTCLALVVYNKLSFGDAIWIVFIKDLHLGNFQMNGK